MKEETKIYCSTPFITPVLWADFPGISDELDIENTPYGSHQDDVELHKSKHFENLNKCISTMVSNYANGIFEHKKGEYAYEITAMWLNCTKPNDMHSPHCHHNSLWSGVFFLNGEKGEFPPLSLLHPFPEHFHLKYEKYNDFNQNGHCFDAIKDRIILFPSAVQHYVEINKTKKIRKTIAFNIIARGEYDHPYRLQSVTI